jgi:outer membrane protein OmpA-like peptidoglycan-associated protein
MPGKSILGGRPNGDYKIVMEGEAKNGLSVKKEASVHLVRQDEVIKKGLRYSILFDFNQPKTVAAYKEFLTKVVAPIVPDNGTLIIHGHSDIIGDDGHNMKLSLERARDAQRILEQAVSKAGKKGIKYEVYGFGGNPDSAPFENNLPEERFYNRTVIIDIVSNK